MNRTRDTRSSSVAIQFLQRFLRDRDAGNVLSLAEYQALFPGHAEIVAAEFAELMVPGPAAGEHGPLAYPAQGDRYRGAVAIGRGGMGTVVRVFDPSLERTVAMKLLSGAEGQLPDAHVLGRFLDEAKITGQLQHPGIVSVFEIGLDADRRPYFTMPLIAGRSLQELIGAVHAGDEQWTQLRALNVLVRVCEAVAYAHEHGIVHRDLKPANVMVGDFGETYVVDWGLARVLDRPDRRDIRIRGGDDAPGSAEPASALRTMEGDVIGTPAYMAPEQACGEIDRVGKRSDVYSIGAMLYHLLAGLAPYGTPAGSTTGYATLQRVRSEPPSPLSQVAPAAPAELVAICERAMERDPARRYGSVAELGSDLRAFLENRVVRAHATGPVAELRKWIRRNRATAAASAVALLALVVGFAVSLNEKVAADRSAAAAEQNFELAFDAAEDLLAKAGLYDLENEPGADPVRQELAQKALAYYERFEELRGSDPRVAEKLALTHFRIGNLETQLGHAEQAARAFEAARDAYTQLLARGGDSAPFRAKLAQIEMERNTSLLHAGDTEAALAGLLHTADTVEQLRRADPTSVALMHDACNVIHNLAMALLANGRTDEALQRSERKIEITQKLLERVPEQPSVIAQMGSAYQLRGTVLWRLGRIDEAEASFRQAIEVLERGVEQHPSHRGVRARLGEVLNVLAVVLRPRQPAAAERVLTRAVTVLRELATANPGVRNYHGNLGGALCNLGIMTAVRGDQEAAIDLLGEGRDEINKALQIDPAAADYRDYRRIVGKELGIAQLELGRHADAAASAHQMLRDLPEGSAWEAGRLLAICAKVCGTDTGLAADERARVADAYADEAMLLLRRAAQNGPAKAALLDGRSFDALRDRDDFGALRAELDR
ncbi:MAG TPA: serine/threonine-protein kinase [Planctomycetota bacterium]|nr:serine/threonine-protein kinase [Planctomycetota bacterium]